MAIRGWADQWRRDQQLADDDPPSDTFYAAFHTCCFSYLYRFNGSTRRTNQLLNTCKTEAQLIHQSYRLGGEPPWIQPIFLTSPKEKKNEMRLQWYKDLHVHFEIPEYTKERPPIWFPKGISAGQQIFKDSAELCPMYRIQPCNHGL